MNYNFVLIKFYRNGTIKWYKKFFSLNSIFNFLKKKHIDFGLKFRPCFLDFYAYKICTRREFEHLYLEKI